MGWTGEHFTTSAWCKEASNAHLVSPPPTPSQSSCYMARADRFNTMALETNSPEIKVNLAVMLTEL